MNIEAYLRRLLANGNSVGNHLLRTVRNFMPIYSVNEVQLGPKYVSITNTTMLRFKQDCTFYFGLIGYPLNHLYFLQAPYNGWYSFNFIPYIHQSITFGYITRKGYILSTAFTGCALAVFSYNGILIAAHVYARDIPLFDTVIRNIPGVHNLIIIKPAYGLMPNVITSSAFKSSESWVTYKSGYPNTCVYKMERERGVFHVREIGTYHY